MAVAVSMPGVEVGGKSGLLVFVLATVGVSGGTTSGTAAAIRVGSTISSLPRREQETDMMANTMIQLSLNRIRALIDIVIQE